MTMMTYQAHLFIVHRLLLLSRNSLVILMTLLMLAFTSVSHAGDDPEDELGNWLIYNGSIRFTDRWSLFTEAQARFWEPASSLQEFFVRAIGIYDTSANTQLGLGYTWVKGEPFDDAENEETTENRLIEQFAFKQLVSKSKVEHRFRLEQRWIEKAGDTDYRNRFRYRLQATTPLFKDGIEPKTHFINIYNELFLNFGNTEDNFDQNRLYGAYGYQFSKAANLQLGALWQLKDAPQGSDDFFRLQVFYTHNFDLR